jgi:hypothetical protein
VALAIASALAIAIRCDNNGGVSEVTAAGTGVSIEVSGDGNNLLATSTFVSTDVVGKGALNTGMGQGGRMHTWPMTKLWLRLANADLDDRKWPGAATEARERERSSRKESTLEPV